MTVDFSKHHEIVGDLIRMPKSREEWEQFRLRDEQVAFYHENGYLPGVKILSDKQVEQLREELTAFFDPEHDGQELWYEYHRNQSDDPDNVLFHALGAWRLRAAFHDVLWHPAFTVAASQLLDGAVRFWHDQLFCKPAKHGGVVAWHQDYSYWTRTGPMNHLTCWIALDDCDKENGCLHYVPGSHRWSLLPMPQIAGSLDAISGNLNQEQRDQLRQPMPIEIAAGEACFHHPLTLHGSEGNRSDRPRRAMVINVILDGTQSLSDEPLLEGIDPIPRGAPLSGQFFPLLEI